MSTDTLERSAPAQPAAATAAPAPAPGALPLPAVDVCAVADILPDTGVCARVHGRHVAVFRVGTERFFAIDNVDPKSGASVLSRGLVGNLGDRLVVASPLYKNHVDLATGECLELPEASVQAHHVHVHDGRVLVRLA